VDDSRTIQKVLEMTFADKSYRLLLASDANDALEKLNRAQPAVVLIDVGKGSEDGYDLAHQVKSQSPGTAVLLMSSQHAPFDAARGSMADGNIDKPFDSQKMLDAVAQLATRSPAMRSTATTTPAFKAVPPPPKMSPIPTATEPDPAPVSLVQPTGSFDNPAEPAVATPGPAPASAAANGGAPATAFAEKLAGLGLTAAQVEGVLALSREVVEQVVWEVVPTLAETLIKQEIHRLTSD